MKPVSVAHLTSVHSRTDIRIFVKECSSLAAAGYDVTLLVADGQGDSQNSGVNVIDVGAQPTRFRRMLYSPRQILARALEVDAKIYHLHDPELLTICGALRRAGKVVVFDAHEDVAAQILGKSYMMPLLRRQVSQCYDLYERHICPKLNAVVAATPAIRKKFRRLSSRVVEVNNYPIIGELATETPLPNSSTRQVCYVGGISEMRGIKQVVRAMRQVGSDAMLRLCGSFSEKETEAAVQRDAGWQRVEYDGWLDREGLRDVLRESVAGLVTFLPSPNHVEAQPNKMFEYMSAAVPVIGSDFPLWREIIEGNSCGVCVDPEDPQAIADAIDRLVLNPEEARQLGLNGQRAVTEKYNWAAESRKLEALYGELAE